MINTPLLPHSMGFLICHTDTWQQWIPKDSHSPVKGLSSFPGIIKNRSKTKRCAQAETDGHVVNEIACASVFSELGPVPCSLLPGQGGWGGELDMCVAFSQGRPCQLMVNPCVGWKGSADAPSSFEMRWGSEVHYLQAACMVSSSHPQFCSSVFPLPLSRCSSCPPLQQLWRALSLSTLTRSLYCNSCYTRAYSRSRTLI